MNEDEDGVSEDAELARKDAVFISTHKFLGGPGCPGILVAKKALFRNAVPSIPAGGTVEFVDFYQQEYTRDVEAREEGGTPDILGSIKSALVFSLKSFVGTDTINLVEDSYLSTAFSTWRVPARAACVLGTIR